MGRDLLLVMMKMLKRKIDLKKKRRMMREKGLFDHCFDSVLMKMKMKSSERILRRKRKQKQ